MTKSTEHTTLILPEPIKQGTAEPNPSHDSLLESTVANPVKQKQPQQQPQVQLEFQDDIDDDDYDFESEIRIQGQSQTDNEPWEDKQDEQQGTDEEDDGLIVNPQQEDMFSSESQRK